MNNFDSVWVFNGVGGNVPGGVFTTLQAAESWIGKYSLTGVLTNMPLNKGVFDWAIENNLHNLSAERLEEKRNDPELIGSFSSASQQHYHYENGERE